jgi:hypothetical protein
MARTARKLSEVPEPAPLLKLDLGSGSNIREGFEGVDFVHAEGVKHVVDLFKFPWPFKDQSVEEINCSHFFEHVPHMLRGKFMDEVYRILVYGGKATVITPYYTSIRAIQDFTHEWPPIGPNSFLYFNKGWREQNKLTHGHYGLTCDFDFTYGFSINGNWTTRNDETRNFAMTNYVNAIDDIFVTLVSRKPEEK